MPAPLTADLAPAHLLTTDDLTFLRSLPGSTEPPIEGSREQRARADRLPGALLHRGRRTPLGDLVVSLAERTDAAEAKLRDLLAPADDADDADEAVNAAEVLRLDEVATPAPWRVEGQAIRADLPGGIELRWGTAAYPKDNDFTAYACTAAPRLARALFRARDQLRAAQLELKAADERRSDALAALHDHIENALSAALGHVPVDDCDDRPAAADLESLIELAGRYKRDHDELAAARRLDDARRAGVAAARSELMSDPLAEASDHLPDDVRADATRAAAWLNGWLETSESLKLRHSMNGG